MHQTTNNFRIGTRVTHLGTGEHGTVTATTADDLGQLVTIEWDDAEALELPRTLHAKHLDAFPNVEPGHDTATVAECHRRGLPGTVTELVIEASRQGVKPSALMQTLEASDAYAWATTAGAR